MTQEEDNIYRALISNKTEKKEVQLVIDVLAKILSHKGGVLEYSITASYPYSTLYNIQVSTYETDR